MSRMYNIASHSFSFFFLKHPSAPFDHSGLVAVEGNDHPADNHHGIDLVHSVHHLVHHLGCVVAVVVPVGDAGGEEDMAVLAVRTPVVVVPGEEDTGNACEEEEGSIPGVDGDRGALEGAFLADDP